VANTLYTKKAKAKVVPELQVEGGAYLRFCSPQPDTKINSAEMTEGRLLQRVLHGPGQITLTLHARGHLWPARSTTSWHHHPASSQHCANTALRSAPNPAAVAPCN